MSRYDDLLAFAFPEVEQTYTERDTILYALGVGAGQDRLDPFELRLACEKDLLAIPAMAVTLAYPGFWYRDLAPGLDYLRTVHASERFEIDRPLPVAATVTARPRIVAIHDKGEGRGSLVVSRREIVEKSTGVRLATVTQTAFCRGDGGLGGPTVPAPPPDTLPDAAARPRRRAADPAAVGADLPPLGRRQPVARRPRLRPRSRLPEPDPARPVHLRPRLPRPDAPRRRRRPPHRRHGLPLHRPGLPRRHTCAGGLAQRRPAPLPRRRRPAEGHRQRHLRDRPSE